MVDMVKRDIFPAVSSFSGSLAAAIAAKKSVLPDLDCSAEEDLLRRVSGLMGRMAQEREALEDAMAGKDFPDAYEAAHYYKYTIFTAMETLRGTVDTLETMTAASYWPYPSYMDLLFSIK